VAVPTVPSTEDIKVMVLFASAVPVKVGVLLFVKLSTLDIPVSVSSIMSGVEGAAGSAISIDIARAEDTGLILPAAFVAVAVIL